MTDHLTMTSDQCILLVSSMQVGSPIAEDDNLLYDARVEHAVFGQLIRDEIDIVRGTKGSGKSAMYKLLASPFVEFKLSGAKIVLLKGVEVAGDPIFAKFKKDFETLDETDFQTFWRIYFISLITAHFIEAPEHQQALKVARSEIREFRRLAEANNFPITESLLTFEGIVKWGLGKIPTFRMKVDPTGQVSGELELRGPAREAGDEKTPVFVMQLHEALIKILDKAGFRLWVMLDRLDEVFPRRSAIEATALRALLRTTRAFPDSYVRLKLFIRDDIFDSVTDSPGGFTAMTHIMSRCSDTLQWNRDQIQDLIVKRVFSSSRILSFFAANQGRINKDQGYAREQAVHIFPERIRKGKNQSRTIDWIYKHCEDANGVVTPRDVIDLLLLARGYRINELKSQPSELATLLSTSSVLYGHSQMSKGKRVKHLKAEFPHFWPEIEKFENQKADHHADSLQRILGDNWKSIAKDLMSIGFLKQNAKGGTFSIPYLYRSCLSIKRGRADLNGDSEG